MNSKKPLHSVTFHRPVSISEACFDGQGISPAIRVGYEKDGIEYRRRSKVTKVLATRERAERCCTVWYIEGAYDTLVEIEDSAWIREMRADTQEMWREKWQTHH